MTQKSDNPCFEKALLWSIRTNRAIHALPAEDRPFPNVKSAMDAMAKQADLAAVSSANGRRSRRNGADIILPKTAVRF